MSPSSLGSHLDCPAQTVTTQCQIEDVENLLLDAVNISGYHNSNWSIRTKSALESLLSMSQKLPGIGSKERNVFPDSNKASILLLENFMYDNDTQKLTESAIDTIPRRTELIKSLCSPPSPEYPDSSQTVEYPSPAKTPLFLDSLENEAPTTHHHPRIETVDGCAFSATVNTTVNTSKEPWENHFGFKREMVSLDEQSEDGQRSAESK